MHTIALVCMYDVCMYDVCMYDVYTVWMVHWLMNVVVNIGYISRWLAPISAANTCIITLLH